LAFFSGLVDHVSEALTSITSKERKDLASLYCMSLELLVAVLNRNTTARRHFA